MSIEIETTNGPAMKFNGKYDDLIPIGELYEHDLNKAYRRFHTQDSKEKYNSLEKEILIDGLNEALKVFMDDEPVTRVSGGHTRAKVLKTNGAKFIPVIWDRSLDGKNQWDPDVVKSHFSDNSRVETADINKFYSIETVVDELKFDKKSQIEDICGRAGLSYLLYSKCRGLKHGYTNKKGQFVRPVPHLITDLEQGTKGYSITQCYNMQKQDHDMKYNPKNRSYPQDPALDKLLENISDKFVRGVKAQLQLLTKTTTNMFPDVRPFEVADPQFIGSNVHYAAAAYFADEITNSNSEYHAEVGVKNTTYDIYVYDKRDKIAACIEVKTTQGNGWTSSNPKGGYHLLLAYSQEYNFWSSIMYFEASTWAGGVKGKYTLSAEDVSNASTFNHEYCGKMMKNDGKIVIFKDEI